MGRLANFPWGEMMNKGPEEGGFWCGCKRWGKRCGKTAEKYYPIAKKHAGSWCKRAWRIFKREAWHAYRHCKEHLPGHVEKMKLMFGRTWHSIKNRWFS